MTSSLGARSLNQSDKGNMNRLPSVSSLMSPPESKPYDSFNPSFSPCEMSQETTFGHEMTLPPLSVDRKRTQSEMNLPSPPVTPYTGNKKRKPDALELAEKDIMDDSTRDPVLFERQDTFNHVATNEPLFSPMPPQVVEQHINSHMARFDNRLDKPTREEYRIALDCIPNVSAQYNRNPREWARREREILDRQLLLMNRNHPKTMEAEPKGIESAPAKRAIPSQPRVQRTPRPKRTPKSTPKQKTLESFDLPTPSASKTRAIATNRDDTDFNSIQDYCPALETIGGNAKALKADWKGQMLDLSNDPDRSMLSSAEVHLASTLRLSCATYLCSKRRIFEARFRALKINKEFRKTDAQQACKIDVNKASKLWTAYERVGWFKPEHFRQYLR